MYILRWQMPFVCDKMCISDMKPSKNVASTYLFAVGVAGQIGCVLVIIVGGGVLLCFFLDQVFGTRPLFIFLLLLASIPLNLWAIYRYTVYQSKRLQAASSQKEDNLGEH